MNLNKQKRDKAKSEIRANKNLHSIFLKNNLIKKGTVDINDYLENTSESIIQVIHKNRNNDSSTPYESNIVSADTSQQVRLN